MTLLYDVMTRLGWRTVVLCASCGRTLPFGAPPAICPACVHGYVTADKQWIPASVCSGCHRHAAERHRVLNGPGWYCAACWKVCA